MPSVSHTLGPLHLEDLEPHRFEDLIRQLVYDFRNWRMLEATGRSGADEGFDVRGWEIVPNTGLTVTQEAEDEDEEARASASESDRLWLLQCKREKTITPSKLKDYLDGLAGASSSNLYGVLLAAACDFSIKARDIFRAWAREAGLCEAHLWGKGEVEDLLFQPRNDHLLFAYFGVSLQTRRRTLRTDVRSRLAIKRKALRLLPKGTEVLIRDASDDRYPHSDPDKTKEPLERGRWFLRTHHGCHHDGLHFLTRRHLAYIDDDGIHWDFAETDNQAHWSSRDPWRKIFADADHQERERVHSIWSVFPERNRATFVVEMVLPYEAVLDIDENGDEWFQGPHVYTTPFDGPIGPFRNYSYPSLVTVGATRRKASADPNTRVEKFPRK